MELARAGSRDYTSVSVYGGQEVVIAHSHLDPLYEYEKGGSAVDKLSCM